MDFLSKLYLFNYFIPYFVTFNQFSLKRYIKVSICTATWTSSENFHLAQQ